MKIQVPRGTQDILPGQVEKWHYVEGVMRRLAAEYGFQEIRTPVFEHTELFQRGVGETTDIVEKEMYTFEDKKGRSLTLRPEGTAGAVRAFIEHSYFAQPQPTKFYYIGPIFRYEAPQAGRYRQHHQFGIEVFGSAEPITDAEVILVAVDLFSRLGLADLTVKLNNIGCPKCRKDYREALIAYFRPQVEALCADCRNRLERNPLRILDCKQESCREVVAGAPEITSHLCAECQEHFSGVQRYLEAAGVKYEVDSGIVRGLDYYTRTVFEIIYTGLGAQSTVCGGGRYDNLIETVGGPPTPGVGFGMGIERLLLTLEKTGCYLPEKAGPDLYIATLGQAAKEAAFAALLDLRRAGLRAVTDLMGRSLKAQLKYANKINARYVAILGENELAQGRVQVKRMADGQDAEVAWPDLLAWLKAQMQADSRKEEEVQDDSR
ncbi:MAG: histidine--tRNA ligase [Firmicutes bacterium]|nr:histidine--tRNA ligase [Bacillota bacterium]